MAEKRILVKESDIQNVADAIRLQRKTQVKMKVGEMASEITKLGGNTITFTNTADTFEMTAGVKKEIGAHQEIRLLNTFNDGGENMIIKGSVEVTADKGYIPGTPKVTYEDGSVCIRVSDVSPDFNDSRWNTKTYTLGAGNLKERDSRVTYLVTASVIKLQGATIVGQPIYIKKDFYGTQLQNPRVVDLRGVYTSGVDILFRDVQVIPPNYSNFEVSGRGYIDCREMELDYFKSMKVKETWLSDCLGIIMNEEQADVCIAAFAEGNKDNLFNINLINVNLEFYVPTKQYKDLKEKQGGYQPKFIGGKANRVFSVFGTYVDEGESMFHPDKANIL
ncbi:hypothetical protein [uncultured Veillonella sp.]|uniref:hypothetical protein n=1 Tax=uncultured Veillonella sp. TaxID=159268 RepID=UPI002599CCAE|nr:hypothetical protein [uncultured Veillonella sp.]